MILVVRERMDGAGRAHSAILPRQRGEGKSRPRKTDTLTSTMGTPRDRRIVVRVLGGAAAGGAAVGALGVALAAAFARRVVRWRPHDDERVLAADERMVVLAASLKTRHPGVFGMRYADGYALVGPVVAEGARTVTRELREVSGRPPGRGGVSWEGDVHALPSDVGPHVDVLIDAPSGPAPAWRFGPAENTTWAIHIHGIRSTRDGALRTVPAADAEGLSSLVVSYRGDGDAAPAPGGASRLGLDEADDVDAAIGFAVERGAERIVLVGWSMGGGIALRLTERSAHRERIAGLVLVGPATDWRAAIRSGAAAGRVPLPGAAAWIACAALGHPLLSRLAGMSAPVDLDELDWTRPGRLAVPTLVVHSRADRTVPFDSTERFAAANPGLVEVQEAPAADHSWEYNVAPEWFTETVRAWLRAHVA